MPNSQRPLTVSDIRFASAGATLRARGVLGWVNCKYGQLQLDCIGVRRKLDGEYTLAFPKRVDSNGVAHPIYRPLTRQAYEEIKGDVLDNLRRRGWLA